MTIEQRLAKLERQNKWIKRIGAVGLSVVAAVFLIAQGKPEELPDLVGKSLAIYDKTGKRVVFLKGSWLYLENESGSVALGVTEDAPQVTLRSKSGMPEVTLNLSHLAFSGERDDGGSGPLAGFGVTKDVGGQVKLWDAKGKLSWQTPPPK